MNTRLYQITYLVLFSNFILGWKCWNRQLLGKRDTRQYSKIIRNFAITLSGLSPRGYNYVRTKFGLNLPHVSTIRKWYRHSNICEPGINPEVILALADLVKANRENGAELLVSISLDEMSIRRNVYWLNTEKRFSGFMEKEKMMVCLFPSPAMLLFF